MKKVTLLLVLLGFTSIAAISVRAEEMADTPENRRTEAERYLMAIPTEELTKSIFNKALGSLSKDSRKAVEGFLPDMKSEAMKTANLDALVNHFTTAELKGMADFYGSEIGKSVMKKMPDYTAELMPVIAKEMTRKTNEPVVEEVPVNRLADAQLRLKATKIMEELHYLDAAIDQFAIENNKPAHSPVTPKDLLKYLKPGSRLHTEITNNQLNDLLGNPIKVEAVDLVPKLSESTANALSKVVPEGFWKPYF